MKKILTVLFLICLLLSFVGCSKTARNEEQMIKIIKNEENISDQLQMQVIGTVEWKDSLLLCSMTKNKEQTQEYYASEFKHIGKKFKFIHNYLLNERGADMYSLSWADGYVFISNNQNSTSLQIRFQNIKQEDKVIEIKEVPFVYYLDLSDLHKIDQDYSFEYYFLDEDGNPISL